MQIGINLPQGQGIERSTSGSGSQEAKVIFGSRVYFRPLKKGVVLPLAIVEKG